MIKNIKVNGFDLFRKGKKLSLNFIVEFKDDDKMREEYIRVVYDENGNIVETGSLYSSSNPYYYIECGKAFDRIIAFEGSDFIKNIINKCTELDNVLDKNIKNISNEMNLLHEEKNEIKKELSKHSHLINEFLLEIKKLETDKKRCKKETSIIEKQKLIDNKLEELEKLKSELNTEELQNRLSEIMKKDFKLSRQRDKFYCDYRMAINSIEIDIEEVNVCE